MGGKGSGGKNRKSDELAQLDGTIRKKKPAKEAPGNTVIPTCPTWLAPAAKLEWRRVVPELARLGLLTKLDRAALATYCAAYAHILECEDALKDGLTFEYTNKAGAVNRIQKPEVKIEQSYMKIINSFCTSFGLSPSSRGAMVIPGPPKEEDPIEELLRESARMSNQRRSQNGD